ncbi:uncharacterized protein LOC118504176 [Anopheles stephensi]|uniref:uncharacterized protein LOC118504176 n=1 Tax=Anopheles stephensi TaxID=30069 RepID=UPI001658797C|nr:uncharacterized protein LOC118504176 [Anopheles stephensi]
MTNTGPKGERGKNTYKRSGQQLFPTLLKEDLFRVKHFSPGVFGANVKHVASKRQRQHNNQKPTHSRWKVPESPHGVDKKAARCVIKCCRTLPSLHSPLSFSSSKDGKVPTNNKKKKGSCA